MSNFHLVLMHRESLSKLADAKVLSDRGDSVHLLCLIGVELLLKLIHELTLRRKTTHGPKYELIFRDLLIEIQGEIIKRVGARIGPSALNSGALKIFESGGKSR